MYVGCVTTQLGIVHETTSQTFGDVRLLALGSFAVPFVLAVVAVVVLIGGGFANPLLPVLDG